MKSIRSIGVFVFVFSALITGISYAGQATIPNSFTAGQPASADEVNGNFNAVRDAVDDNYARLPMVWASTTEASGVIAGANPYVAPIQTNNMTITVPSDGVLTFSGSQIVNNYASTYSNLTPYIDGNPVSVPYAAFLMPNASWHTLSYTVTVPISAGTHSVSQAFTIPGAPAVNVQIYAPHLTVTFFPAAQSSYNVFP